MMTLARTVGAWWLDRGITLVACLVAAAAAMYASFDALVRLAEVAGWSEDVRPALPLTVDVIALAAGVRFARVHRDDIEARRAAFHGVVWSGVVSVVGNAIAHAALDSTMQTWERWLAVAVSAVPAVGVGYVVHLLATPGRRRTEDAPATAPEPDGGEHQDDDAAEDAAGEAASDAEHNEHQDDDAAAETIPLFPAEPRPRRRHARTNSAPREGSIKARGLALMDAAAERGETLTTAQLAAALDCTPRHAQNIVNAWEKSA